jgi:hypothetical protein
MLLTAMVAMLLAYAGVAVARADVFHFSETIPAEYTYQGECGGGPLLLAGTQHFRFHIVIDKAGNVHGTANTNQSNFVATDPTTGEVVGRFILSATNHSLNSQLLDAPSGVTIVEGGTDAELVVTKGSLDNLVFHYVLQVVILPDGEPRAEVVRYEFRCAG